MINQSMYNPNVLNSDVRNFKQSSGPRAEYKQYL